MEITKEQIEKINKESPMEWQENEQGIFLQPFGIPDTIKSLVIYHRWESGGVSGGSCWDSSDPQPYTNEDVPKFEVLDIVLRELCPELHYLQYKQIEDMIQDNEESDWEYYGNCTDFKIKFIVLDDLLNYLNKRK